MRALRSVVCALAVLACSEPVPTGPVIAALSPEGARDMDPVYSPDGSRVAFWRVGPNGSHLWIADSAMQSPRAVEAYTALGGIIPIWSPDGTTLTIPDGHDGLANVVTVNAADGAVTPLTTGPVFKVPVQFHPDGDGIVFQTIVPGGRITTQVVSRRTNRVRSLVPGLDVSHVAKVAPDGKTLIIQQWNGEHTTLWISDIDGSNRRALTTEGFEFLPPTRQIFSPDGTEFLFTSRRTGKGDIWVGSLDGTTRQLTTDINEDSDPVWSPDGEWVAFLSDRGRQSNVWIMPAAGGEARRVTEDATGKEALGWIGSGTIVYSAGMSPGALWSHALADDAEVRITPDSVDAGEFWISPDRSRVAFLIDHPGGTNDLAITALRGNDRWIIASSAHHTDVKWSRDGTRIAYTSDAAGDKDVWEAEASGVSAPRRLTDWVGVETAVDWTADGRAVLFHSSKDATIGDIWQVALGADSAGPTRLTATGRVTWGVVSWANGTGEVLVVQVDGKTGLLSPFRQNADKSLTAIPTSADGTGNSINPIPSDVMDVLAILVSKGGSFYTDVVRLDGTPIISLGTSNRALGFSPDGMRLLYRTLQAGSEDLAIMDLESGESHALPTTPEVETHAAFSADGSAVILRRVTITERVMRADVRDVLTRKSP